VENSPTSAEILAANHRQNERDAKIAWQTANSAGHIDCSLCTKRSELMLTPTPQPRRVELKIRARAEFLEMPGLRLTVAQASRLCGATHDECQSVLAELMADGFLYQLRDAYLRADHGRRCA
jgi:hypothetical protein